MSVAESPSSGMGGGGAYFLAIRKNIGKQHLYHTCRARIQIYFIQKGEGGTKRANIGSSVKRFAGKPLVSHHWKLAW